MKLTRIQIRKAILESIKQKTTEQKLVDLLFLPSHAIAAVYMGEFSFFSNILEKNDDLGNKTVSFDLNPQYARSILDALGMKNISIDGKIYKSLSRQHPEGNVYLQVHGGNGKVSVTILITEPGRLM